MFHIDNRSRVPIHQQLQAQIVRYVSLGLLLPDQQLPSVRAMAQQLGINPNTVQKAYAALEMNGVLYTVAGRGAFISPEEDQLSQFKKLAADRFAAAVQAAADAGLTRQELEQIVEEQMERRTEMIEIQDVSKQFDCVTALRHLTLKVQDGSVFGLVGSNGAGKSTLLRILAGVYRPDSGRVLINGQAPFENEQVKRSTVFISDYPYLAPTATVRRLARLYRSVYPGWSEDYFARMEKLFPISFDARLGKMSKGMQRQAAILLGLSTQPRCILFDEIFDGLDPVVRELVKKLLVDFVAENGASVMIASHNLRELEDVCDHVGLLHRGGALCEDDLDRLKLGITRLQFALADPADFETVRAGLNLLKCSQQGKLFEMTVRGTETETLALVQRLHPLFCETLPITLEELFISEMEVAGYDINKVI